MLLVKRTSMVLKLTTATYPTESKHPLLLCARKPTLLALQCATHDCREPAESSGHHSSVGNGFGVLIGDGIMEGFRRRASAYRSVECGSCFETGVFGGLSRRLRSVL